MTKVIRFIRANLFLIMVVMGYGGLMVINPQMSLQGIKNSEYYIKEMLMIMPVIFVLTALLDTWIPKETIMKYLGKEAKVKGTFLAFLLGSISAGPIYAAFPFCVMLHQKGASIKNIVIILSSWAVVKIPMLLNEAKFLGMKFMIIRWIFTVISILIFAWITQKIVKDEDLPHREEVAQKGLFINKDTCMGCTVCTKKYPDVFTMDGKKASIKAYNDLDQQLLHKTIETCPVKAIQYNE
ncbi:permease [Niameybacter massiliensis]|uniref:permease n=1 Tax=Niameybacter massiliensis TaxID=1658108 RepID=UPI0006B666FF|nr:permease [Niameybacter massiliensis]